MADGWIAELKRRGVVAVGGPEAGRFLNDLVTNDLDKIAPGGAGYGGLLTPQGKVLFDFLVFRDGDRFLFEIKRDLAADFARRLTFYRLRAKVEIADLSAERQVVAAWGGAASPELAGLVAPDPRLAGLGYRAIVGASGDISAPGYALGDEGSYDAWRIGLGVPEGGVDFPFGESFPHDADMDQLGGVDFGKGCYVGQEVVSRMEHRGTARRRLIQANAPGALAAGDPITAAGRPIGTVGSTADGTAIALVRLDRAKEAMDAGTALMAGSTAVTLTLPGWARFGWPAGAAAED
ncbi:MAG: folate-binding protein [Bauldia sp.]